jgi:short-subunit dehydrogenase
MDRVVLVTGASSGIGRAAAVRLAAAGTRVIVHGRDPARTDEVAGLAGGAPLVADLSLPGAGAEIAERALAVHGKVDAVVNNAGIGWSGPLVRMPRETAQELLAINLIAPIELTNALLPGMIQRRTGVVCFVGSIAGRLGVAGEAVYSAAKSGIDGFAESLRYELAGSGVAVSIVVPGAVRTPFFDRRGRAYDRSFPRPVEADRVAAAVQTAIDSGRAEMYVPRWLRLPVLARAIAPTVFNRLATRFGEPVRSSDGTPA